MIVVTGASDNHKNTTEELSTIFFQESGEETTVSQYG